MTAGANVIPLPHAPKTGTLPKRPKYQEIRSREYLPGQEIDLLINAAGKTGRHDHRDATLNLLLYRRGLRILEWVSLR